MKYHEFTNTDLRVSQLCFGCWGVISDAHWGDRKEDESWQAMQAAIDTGVNFFDTAPMYGNGTSEMLLGRFLEEQGLRNETVIATKIRPGMMRPEQVQSECEDSLKRLRTDHIDLYQTHWTDRTVPIADTWGAMQRLREQGKVRHIGVCNMGLQDMSETIPPPLTNQLPYNLLSRMIEAEILPHCIQHQIGVLVYSPLLHGLLADKYKTAQDVPAGRARTRHFSSTRPETRHTEAGCETELFEALERIRAIAKQNQRTMADLALAWIIQQPGIVSVIAGASNESQMRNNVRFLENPLSQATLSQLDEATHQVKQLLGTNPDLWDGGEQSRYR